MAQVRVTVTVPALPIFSPAQYQQTMSLELGTAMTGLVEDIATEARTRTPVGVTGLLRASIATRVSRGEDAVTLVRGEVFTGAQAPYAQYVEEGTRPHWPPRAPIELWAARVLGDARLWFVVARAISRRGTAARWMLRDALAMFRAQIQPRLQAAADRAAKRLGGQP